MTKNRNPFKLPTSKTKQVRISTNLYNVILKEMKKQQKISDMKFGKGKYKVSQQFASDIIGRLLQ